MELTLPPHEVAKAALCEAGRPDLAERVYANRAGWPSMRHHDNEHDIIVRAFYLAHLSAGHRCRIGRGLSPNFEWVPSIDCDTCLEASDDR